MNWTDLLATLASVITLIVAVLLIRRIRILPSSRKQMKTLTLIAEAVVAIVSGLLAIADIVMIVVYGIDLTSHPMRDMSGLVSRLTLLATVLLSMAIADTGIRSGDSDEGNKDDTGTRE
ncbi:hypothetical protein COO72_02480 [Bifidobacterium callitrichos]|nr:hypothetical protein COO72_02480 [Bifidobacterium callitrichos]